MNLPLPQYNVLLHSQTCFYLVLNQQAGIILSNEFFQETFPSTINFLQLLDEQDIDLFRDTTNELLPSKLVSCALQMRPPQQKSFSYRWEFLPANNGNAGELQAMGFPMFLAGATTEAQGQLIAFNDLQQAHSAHFIESEERYKFLFYHNPLPMWIYDMETLRFIEVNEAAVNQYGYSEDEFLQMTVTQIRPPEEVERYLALQRSADKYNPKHKGRWKHQKKNKEIIDVQVTAHLMQLNGQQAKLVLINDITEQIKAEENLLFSNERYNFASRATFDAIWDWDATTDTLFWGEGYKNLFGYDLDQNPAPVETWFNNIHPDERERVNIGLERAVKLGANNWIDEYRFMKADGSYAYIIDRGIIIRDATGECNRMIGAMQDITTRKLNEQQLQKINLQLLRQQKERELTASILRSLSEKELLNNALEDILQKLTIFFNFEIGEAWFVNIDRNRVELRQKWSASKTAELFYSSQESISYKAKQHQFLGANWPENEIIFIDDLLNYETFLRKEGAKVAGLTISLGVPIIFKGKTIAVFTFFGKSEIADREKIRQYFESLSLQLGIDIQRKRTEEELNKFFELSPDILSIIGFDGSFKKINASLGKILGYPQQQLLQMKLDELVYPEDLAIAREQFKKLESGDTIHYFENRYRVKDGGFRWLAWSSTPLPEDKVIYATAKDITEKKLFDEKLNRILESISDGFFTVDKESAVLYWNQRAEKILNLKREDVLGKSIFSLFNGIVSNRFFAEYKQAFERNITVHFEEFIPSYNTWFEISAYPFEGILSVFFKDVTERKKSEEIIRVSGERYEVLAKATKDTIWDWNLQTDDIVWNEGLKNCFNYPQPGDPTVSGWKMDNVHPDDVGRVREKIYRHISEKKTHWEDEYRFRCENGEYKYIYDRGFTIYNDSNEPIRMIGSMQDLTETKANELILKELNDSLEKRAAQLATSNAELERFAYVASHDLQEPLRMVSSFLQLIEKKYKDKLDRKAHEYIGFAVDGAERMKGLILDLLEYSRVNSNKETKEDVDLNEVATNLVLTYNDMVKKTGGKLIFENLPVVKGIRLQLTQLFQNLISNALKYRSELPPEIHIGYAEKDIYYQFSVKDNGIGIEPRFYNKIFVIFQRLHNKNEFSGTGIGLAICKKIIELHAGNIWVESEPGNGSTFYFTLPKIGDEELADHNM